MKKIIQSIAAVLLLSTSVQGQDVVIESIDRSIKEGNTLSIGANGKIVKRAIQIGDYVNGGIVFYVDESGQHGLVASIENIHGNIIWSPDLNKLMGAAGSGIGSGQANSSLIQAKSTITSLGQYAANICQNYTATYGSTNIGGWFLPSIGELEILFDNYQAVNTAINAVPAADFTSSADKNLRPEVPYWSSTESTNNTALYHFRNQDPMTASNFRNFEYWVRGVKSF